MTKKSNGPTLKEIKKAREELWRMGSLEWKLKSHQKEMYKFYHEKPDKIIVINCSRQIGKSVFLGVIALEQCVNHPNSIVKLLQPKQNMIRRNFKPIMNMLLEDCPKDMFPEFKTQDNTYVFPNGSEIQLAGTDNGNADNIRGGKAHLCLIDEAGFCNELNDLISSILIPTTLQTNGRIILCSTTSTDPNHEFIQQIKEARVKKTLLVRTIYDVLRIGIESGEEEPQIDNRKIEIIIKGTPGGDESDAFRTEYLCEIITDSDRAVVPEFTKNEKDIVVPWVRPPFCDKYVSMDIGVRDLTVVLFGYYDFQHAVLVIEDEFVINGNEMNTDKLAEGIREKEYKNWLNKLTGELEKPYMRVCDNNALTVINDLAQLHNLYFRPTDKQNKNEALNQVKIMFNNNQIVINPRCEILINHLRLATWDKTKKDYTRSKDNGHFDAVDALVYMVRNVNLTHNPYPKGYQYEKLGNRNNLFINDIIQEEYENQALKKFASRFQAKTSLRKKAK